MSILDTTIVATAVFTIGVDLESLKSVNWVALAYTLTYLGFSVPLARLSDIVGRRNTYIAAYTIFLAFSLACGFAQTLNQLIITRTFQGIGAAGLYSMAFVIFMDINTERGQTTIPAIAGSVLAVAGVLGPLLGGIITNYTTWRWIFWMNGPILIVPLVAFTIAWPKPHQLRPFQPRPLKQLDPISSFLIIAASVLIVFSFQNAGIEPGTWDTATFIAPILCGILAWILLFAWELYVERRLPELSSMFPINLARRKAYMGYVLIATLGGVPYLVITFALPTRFQVVNGKSVLMAGVGLLPMFICAGFGGLLGGAFNKQRDNTFYTGFIGSIFLVIGSASLSSLDGQADTQPALYGLQVFIGLGFGLTISTASLGSSLHCEMKDLTVAQGIVAQMRICGGSIGIAACTAILGVLQRRNLINNNLMTEAQLETLESSADSLSVEQLIAVRKVYSDAFRSEMIVCAAASAACAVAALLLWGKREPILEIRTRQQEVERKRLAGLKVEK